MELEIERKFLVRDDSWRLAGSGVRCAQGYLAVGPPVSIRVRIMDGVATLTIKQAVLRLTRNEYEYEIPLDDAEALLSEACTGFPIDKTRYTVLHDGMRWEVDEFHGENTGLVVAEIELESVDQEFALPLWLGEEVSGDARYLNSSLSRVPYSRWV